MGLVVSTRRPAPGVWRGMGPIIGGCKAGDTATAASLASPGRAPAGTLLVRVGAGAVAWPVLAAGLRVKTDAGALAHVDMWA